LAGQVQGIVRVKEKINMASGVIVSRIKNYPFRMQAELPNVVFSLISMS
jgi:hypothetical protein